MAATARAAGRASSIRAGPAPPPSAPPGARGRTLRSWNTRKTFAHASVALLPPLPCTQGGGLGWGVLRHRARPTLALNQNRLQHRMEILEHVGIHKPDHVQTFLSQHLTPSFVILLSPLVRISVQLHDELRSRA